MDIKKQYEDLVNKNYFEILDAKNDTPQNVLARTRRKMLSKYHPDRHSGEAKETATLITSIINIAYEALTDEKFKERYTKSGHTLRYGVSDDVPKKANKPVAKSLRGKNYITILSLTGKELFEGGVHNVIVQETNETHSVEIPPNMKKGSHFVLKGLGEKNESGEHGDLLIILSKSEDDGVPPMFTNGESVVPIYKQSDLKKVSFYGSENLTEGKGMLYLKQSDISSEGIIIDYVK